MSITLEDGVMGICSVSRTVLIVPVTISSIVCTLLSGVFVLHPSVLIKSLNVSHYLSRSVLTGGGWMLRGGIFTYGEVTTCGSRCSLDCIVSLTNPSLLLWSLSDLLECFDISLPDLDLDLFVPELPLRLILGVGSLTGSKHNLSKGILAILLPLYILNS